MKWIVLSILIFIPVYTYLTLHYRKPGPEYEPYADMRRRANTGRLLEAGYRRVVLDVERPTDVAPGVNSAMPAPGGIPEPLNHTIVARPLLPVEITAARAATRVRAREPYVLQFRCAAPDDHQQLGAAELYIRGDEIVITPDFDRLTGGLEARTRDNFVTLTIPAGTLHPGSYRVTLVGQRESRAWLLTVQ